ERERLVALAGGEPGLRPLRVRGLDARVLRLDGERLELAVDEPFDHAAVVIDRRVQMDDDAGQGVLIRCALVRERRVGGRGERARELAARDEEVVQIRLALGLTWIAHRRHATARRPSPRFDILALHLW